MKSYIRNWVIFALACLPALASPIILNPSFEEGTASGSFLTVNAGGTDVQDWTVLAESIDYIGPYWQAAEGTRSVDLSGNAPGGISQTISGFTIGGSYKLSFYLAGNPDGEPITKLVTLSITGQDDKYFSFDTTGRTKQNMGYELKSFGFVATETDLTMTFTAGANSGPYGASLDNLSITEDLSGLKAGELQGVPEPTSMALVGLGLVALGFARRRR